MVVNVEVEVVTDVSVRVSWDSLDIPEITGYIVYYSKTENEQSANVTTSTNSVVIGDLMNNMEYQFQVAAIAELGGVSVVGERLFKNISKVVVALPTTASKSSPGIKRILSWYIVTSLHTCTGVVAGILVSIVAVATIVAALLVVVFYIKRK